MGTKGKKVLVVDDDPSLRSLAAAVLGEEYEILEAVDGQDAWEKAGDWRPDLVVTDLMMPRMHGYELCGLLKGPSGIPGVKVIIASSKPFATDKAQAFAAGADEYVVKPFDVAELLEKAAKVLSGGGPAAAAPAPAAGNSALKEAEKDPAEADRGDLPMYVRFWGTRGSCPAGGAANVRYGANTPCTEVRIGDTVIILDCGTGLRELGNELMREFAGRRIDGHIFVGHTHWDHIQGFPFFVPFYIPGNRFRVYSVRGAHGSLKNIFSEAMALDYFPIPLSSLACRLDFVEMTGAVDAGPAKVAWQHLNHPGVCIGFRIDYGGRRVTYLSDHEMFYRLGGDTEVSRRQDADLEEFARGSDLLIMEAQYTEQEYASRKGWGHSTYDDVTRFAIRSGAARLAVFHHDPSHTDDMLDRNIEYCRRLAAAAGFGIDCFGAQEGLKVDIGSRRT